MAEGTTVVGGIVVKDERRQWMLNDSERYPDRWSEELAGWTLFGSSI